MKNYFIIGGSSGIGQEITKRLALSDCNIYASFKNNRPENTGLNVHYSQLDVLQDEQDLDFLPDKLDGLVYCPGSINLKPFRRIKPDDFADDYKLQLLGAIRLIQSCFKKLRSGNGASIIMFSSVAVQQGFNFHSQVSASKGAVEGLTLALAAEFAPNIRVNCIAPSLTDTPLSAGLLNSDEKKETNARRHPLKRIGSVQDIASMAEFLLSEQSAWITGQIMHVDGGMSSIKQ